MDEQHHQAAANIRRVLSVWDDIEDLVNVGAYAAGSNVEFDLAVRLKPVIDEFLAQRIAERAVFEETCAGVRALSERIDQERTRLGGGITKSSGVASSRTESVPRSV